MYLSVASACLVLAVLVLPRKGRIGLRASVAIIFVVLGESALAFSAVSDLLLVALMFLAAGLLWLAEIAAGDDNPLIGLIWIGCGGLGLWKHNEIRDWAATERPWVALAGMVGALVLGVLAILGHRRRTRPAYDPHDTTGI